MCVFYDVHFQVATLLVISSILVHSCRNSEVTHSSCVHILSHDNTFRYISDNRMIYTFSTLVHSCSHGEVLHLA